jgi:predicted nucleic acid-binding protein
MLVFLHPQHPALPTFPSPRPVVLDTNVVLDWLLFGHPDGRAVGNALAGGELCWIATPAMRDEFAHVVTHGAFGRREPDVPALLGQWAVHCQEVRPPAAPVTRWRCTDPDDQKFIDLAAATTGCLLLSRDRAVLRLSRRLASVGVQILPPAAWLAPTKKGDRSRP